MEGPAAVASSGTPAPSGAPAASPAALPTAVTVLDTYPEVAPLLDSGVAALSRSVVAVLQSQVEASTAELTALERANTIVAAQYSEVRDGASELAAFYAQHGALAASLAPHLALVEEVERCAAGLEEAARELDEQTKSLEQAFAELL